MDHHVCRLPFLSFNTDRSGKGMEMRLLIIEFQTSTNLLSLL